MWQNLNYRPSTSSSSKRINTKIESKTLDDLKGKLRSFKEMGNTENTEFIANIKQWIQEKDLSNKASPIILKSIPSHVCSHFEV